MVSASLRSFAPFDCESNDPVYPEEFEGSEVPQYEVEGPSFLAPCAHALFMRFLVSYGALYHETMSFPVELPPPLLLLAEDLGLNPSDVEEQFTRGTGKGGQKMNKTSSTVWLKHLPTGLEVKVQRHREQSKNRISAWKLLILKLEERVKGKESKHAKAIFKIQKQKQRRSRKAKEKMLTEKHQRADLKESRRAFL